MPARDWLPPPAVRPLAYVSPSTATQLRRCSLRVAFGHSSAHQRLISRGSATRLGNIAHDVIMVVGLGALDGLDPTEWDGRIAVLWDERSDREAADVASSFSDASLRHPSSWRNAEERFAATLFECRDLAASRARGMANSTQQFDALRFQQLTPTPSGFGSQEEAAGWPMSPLFENELATRDGRIRGRPDHIDIVGGELVVEDYKSGTVFDTSDDSTVEPQIRDDYRRQLLLYAVLCHETFGRWPMRLVLRPIGGSPITIEVTGAIEREATTAASEALALLDRYNATAGSNPWQIANSNADSCQSCPFRGPCDPFWQNARPDWPPPDRPAITGTVSAITTLGSGRPLLTIQATSDNVPSTATVIQQFTREQLTTPTRGIDVSDHIRIINLRRRDDEISASSATEVWLSSAPIV